MARYVKRRSRPAPGSIAEALDIFGSEVRFYLQIAPVIGVRVPTCYRASSTDDGTELVLEDLGEWLPGADPLMAARVLARMHHQWAGQARQRWPWLRQVGAAAGLLEYLFSQAWPRLAGRPDLTPPVRTLGQRLLGKVAQSQEEIGSVGPLTLVHGDASLLNMRTGPSGEVALLDWEDVSAAPGLLDLAWLLVSSVEPAHWDDVITVYGQADGLIRVLPAVAVQGLFSLADIAPESAEAAAWVRRLEAVAGRLSTC